MVVPLEADGVVLREVGASAAAGTSAPETPIDAAS